jgi:hypothetical protein
VRPLKPHKTRKADLQALVALKIRDGLLDELLDELPHEPHLLLEIGDQADVVKAPPRDQQAWPKQRVKVRGEVPGLELPGENRQALVPQGREKAKARKPQRPRVVRRRLLDEKHHRVAKMLRASQEEAHSW